jgi:hypothetical protein
MAIRQVQQPPKKNMLAPVAQIGGVIASAFNPAVGAAISGAGTAIGQMQAEQAPGGTPGGGRSFGSPAGVDVQDSIGRRIVAQQDADAVLEDARLAIDEIDIPEQQKQDFLKPLLQARQQQTRGMV